jgi:DHA1 family bicyclomycin/chloramphenicol resistance-like MFS transporter
MSTSARPAVQPTRAASTAGLSLPVLLTLGALTAVAPLVTDMYLPALPDLARALGTSDALAQLSMSVTLVGLALGQLVVGPLSDRVGRMAPLRWGILALAVTSFLCAVAGNVVVLLALRLAQGLAGAAALVIARAIVRDLCSGARAAKVFSELMLVMGLAPVVGPVLGGQLLRFTDWRGIFVTLGFLSLALLVACRLVLTETRPARSGTNVELPTQGFRSLLRHRQFLGFMALGALLGTVLFSYISMSSFVLRERFGLGPVAYSCVFGGNAVGMIVGSQVNARLVGARGPAVMLRRGLGVTGLATGLTALALATPAPLAAVLVPLWFVLAGLGGSLGNATALALAPHGEHAGTASALLGASQFLLGATVPPLVSVGGATALALGVVMAVAGLGALLLVTKIVRPTDP